LFFKRPTSFYKQCIDFLYFGFPPPTPFALSFTPVSLPLPGGTGELAGASGNQHPYLRGAILSVDASPPLVFGWFKLKLYANTHSPPKTETPIREESNVCTRAGGLDRRFNLQQYEEGLEI